MSDVTERLRSALADSYTVERELGSGGMATVYLARDLKHGRNVAVKVLRPELAATLGTERFVREIEIAANLTHPHILPLFDSGEAGGFLYYVMPYIEGETLRQRLARESRLPIEEIVRLTDQIASALTYAHQCGVVHRDIKPENVLLVHDQAIVADFGIARAIEAAGSDGLTRTGLAMGTPAYMSPEQALGQPAIDGRTDVYALGCVVYEMVSGRSPLEGLSPQALLARHAAGKSPRLRATGQDVPLFVERAVERALATNPADRFATAGEFAAALTTGTIVARVRRPLRRRLITAGGVALVLLAGWGISTALDATRIKRLAVLPLTDLTGDSTQAYLVAGVHEALIKELGKLGLQVTALTSMRRYQGTEKSIGEIARELDVQAVIEGSFFRQGDSLEISARLYDRAESEIWNGSYDGDLPNAIALYRGFARAIADKVRARLSPAAKEGLTHTASVNPAVYEAYLRGMHLLHHPARQPEDVADALHYFNQAIEADPADPLAYTGAAAAYVTMGHGPAPPPDVWPRARANAERAMRLDSTIAEVWSAMAQIKYYYEWDWAGAERAFRRANALNPSLPGNRYHYAWYLLTVGRGQEGIVEHEKARELDPLTPVYTVWLAGMYAGMGDHKRAIAEATGALERYPDHPIALYNLGRSARELGRNNEAIAAHERMASLNPRWRSALGITYALAGRTEDARRIVAEMEAVPPNSWIALGLAELHAALGDREAALKWLEYQPRHAWWMGIGDSPVFDQLRDEPRFQALVRQINLPRPPRD